MARVALAAISQWSWDLSCFEGTFTILKGSQKESHHFGGSTKNRHPFGAAQFSNTPPIVQARDKLPVELSSCVGYLFGANSLLVETITQRNPCNSSIPLWLAQLECTCAYLSASGTKRGLAPTSFSLCSKKTFKKQPLRAKAG